MNRRLFSKTTFLGSLSLGLLPQFFYGQSSNGVGLDQLMGKTHPELFGEDYKLRKEAHLAFLELRAAAEKDGLPIMVVSSFRDFNHQKRIWERKFKRNREQGLSSGQNINKIVEYSTIPGTSRHHWGTDIDIVTAGFGNLPNILSASHFEKGEPFHELGVWLENHAATYGFYRVYTDVPDRKGFKFEPWHYSYKPLSYDFLQWYLDNDIAKLVREEKFEGSEHLSDGFMSSYITNHLMDINPELLP